MSAWNPVYDLSQIRKISTRVPLARGICTHGRPVLWNLAVFDEIVHGDDWTECDGDITELREPQRPPQRRWLDTPAGWL